MGAMTEETSANLTVLTNEAQKMIYFTHEREVQIPRQSHSQWLTDDAVARHSKNASGNERASGNHHP